MILTLISYRSLSLVSLSSFPVQVKSPQSAVQPRSRAIPWSRQSRSLVVGVFQSIVVEGPGMATGHITQYHDAIHLLWLCQDEWAYPTPCNREYTEESAEVEAASWTSVV